MEIDSKYPEEAGIYKLTCIDNGKVYVGKAINLRKRLAQHKNSKRRYALQSAILKYGWDSFTVEILETVKNFDKLKDNVALLDKESYYIELFESSDREKGYNLCKYSNDTTGVRLSDETREKMRQSRMGKTHSDESKKKMSLSSLGKPKSEQHKENLRKPKSEETKEKMRLAQVGNTNHLGKPHSDESKEKMRLAKLGKKRKPYKKKI